MPEAVQLCDELPLGILQLTVFLSQLLAVLAHPLVLRLVVLQVNLQLLLLLQGTLPLVLQALVKGGEGREGEGKREKGRGGEGRGGEGRGGEGRGGEGRGFSFKTEGERFDAVVHI